MYENKEIIIILIFWTAPVPKYLRLHHWLNPVMYAHLSLFGKNHDNKGHFSQFLKSPLQFIKITLHSRPMGYMGINCFAKTLLSRNLCVF